jgi:hypothetical protein
MLASLLASVVDDGPSETAFVIHYVGGPSEVHINRADPKIIPLRKEDEEVIKIIKSFLNARQEEFQKAA